MTTDSCSRVARTSSTTHRCSTRRVYVLCGCVQFVHLVQTHDRAKIVERVHVALIGEDLLSSSSGYPSAVRRKKRSSCASGSGKVPSYSIGFSVASRRNG